jgi:hypothetical protein
VGVKALDSNGSGSTPSVLRGIDSTIAYRRRYGSEAVNLSLGNEQCSDGTDAMSRGANRAAEAGLS